MDSGTKNPFVFVANSFEEFIDGLMTEAEVIRLDY